MKNYQNSDMDAAIPVRASVSVAMDDVAATMREGLLALAVGAGLQVMQALMDESVTALCGPKGKHRPDRSAVRHGTEDGSVTLCGRRIGVRRPRVRAVDGAGALGAPSAASFGSRRRRSGVGMANPAPPVRSGSALCVRVGKEGAERKGAAGPGSAAGRPCSRPTREPAAPGAWRRPQTLRVLGMRAPGGVLAAQSQPSLKLITRAPIGESVRHTRHERAPGPTQDDQDRTGRGCSQPA